MAGYIRQSTFVDGDTITAALFNNEYNQLVNSFSNTSGHKHDGTTAEGPVIGLIGDAGETSPNNKVLIDTTNNYIEFYVEVSSAPVQQLYIADGAIIPVTDSDIDLGTTSLRFKDTYTDTVTTTGNVSIGGNLTVTGNATISGNLTFGDADTDSINLAAEIDSDIIPNTDGTYDLGSSTKEWQDLFIDGTANIDSLIADTADINGGTIDGATIATSDITVGSGKTLDVSAGTLTLADNQISGDKVEGGTIAATTITTLASTTGNITTVNSTTTNATTVDSTNLEVTNLKAKDGTAAGSIANSTGVVTLGSSVLTTTDINGGTIDGSTIATSDITVGTGKTLDVSSGTLTLANNQISGDKVEGGTIAATTITDLTFGSLNDGTITVTAFADEDDMSSDSATLVPTQQSVKAYVDSQVTAQDLDFQGDSGGALSIDLDSESLTIAGGTGLDTVGSGNTVTVNIDATVATLTGSQTLTNKTIDVDNNTVSNIEVDNLKSGVLDTDLTSVAATDTTLASAKSIKTYVDAQVTAQDLDFAGDTGGALSIDLDSESLTIAGGTGIDTSGATNTLTVAIDSTVATLTGTQTLTNKTLTSPVLNTGVSGTAILDEDNMASNSATQLASQQSIKAYVDAQVGGVGGGDVVDDTTPQLGGDLDLNSNDITGTGNINITGTIQSSGNITGTLATAAQPNITSLGTLTALTGGTGDLNWDSGTLFVDSSANAVGIGTTSPTRPLDIVSTDQIGIQYTNSTATSTARLYVTAGTASGILQQYGNTHSTNASEFRIAASAGDITLAPSSVERVRVTTSGNVGIGTTSPSYKLEVYGAGFNAAQISGDSTSETQLRFNGNTAARIHNESNTALIFATNASEAARFDNAGNFVIGGTSPLGSATFTVDSDSAAISVFDSSAASGGYLQFRNNNTAKGILGFGSNAGASSVNNMILGTNTGSLQLTVPETAGAAVKLEFGNNDNTTRRTVQAYKDNFEPVAADTGVIGLGTATNQFKDLYLSGGTYLGGTAAGNHLDDYEEGTWTPELKIGNSSTDIVHNIQAGKYVKIGRLVYIHCHCSLSDKSDRNGNVSIHGIPFNTNFATAAAGIPLTPRGKINISGDELFAYPASTYFNLYRNGTDGGTNSNVQATNIYDDTDIDFNFVYYTDS